MCIVVIHDCFPFDPFLHVLQLGQSLSQVQLGCVLCCHVPLLERLLVDSFIYAKVEQGIFAHLPDPGTDLLPSTLLLTREVQNVHGVHLLQL